MRCGEWYPEGAARDFTISSPPTLAPYGPFAKLLIDPPRQGAIEIVKSLAAPSGHHAPQRIVYVSCDTATLARDAGVLVHLQGYRLAAAGIVNMFPHPAHGESITLFEKGENTSIQKTHASLRRRPPLHRR